MEYDRGLERTEVHPRRCYDWPYQENERLTWDCTIDIAFPCVCLFTAAIMRYVFEASRHLQDRGLGDMALQYDR